VSGTPPRKLDDDSPSTPAPGAPGASATRLIYRKPGTSLARRSTHYCPGLGHGIVHQMLSEIMTNLELPAHTIAVLRRMRPSSPTTTFNVDFVEAPHGRAQPWPLGYGEFVRRAFVLTYQATGEP